MGATAQGVWDLNSLGTAPAPSLLLPVIPIQAVAQALRVLCPRRPFSVAFSSTDTINCCSFFPSLIFVLRMSPKEVTMPGFQMTCGWGVEAVSALGTSGV